jgi:hypothetical protein
MQSISTIPSFSDKTAPPRRWIESALVELTRAYLEVALQIRVPESRALIVWQQIDRLVRMK